MHTPSTKEDLMELVLELIQNGTLESFTGEPIAGRVRATNMILDTLRAQMAEEAIYKFQQDNPYTQWKQTFKEAMQDAMACVDFASALPKELVETGDRLGLRLHATIVTA